MRISLPSRVIAFLFIALLYALSAADANATTRRVPADYLTIQQAINAAVNGDTVLVAAGSYIENINFLGKAITVKSEAGPNSTIIDGHQAGSVILFASGEGRDSVLDGFTLRNGKSTNAFKEGGGVSILFSSPIIINNIIINNSALFGGGVGSDGGTPLILHNTVMSNFACFGNGISIRGGSQSVVQGNIISQNIATGCSDGFGGEYLLGAP